MDTEVSPMTIAVEGTVVGTARVQDGAIAMAFIDQWWAGWAELLAREEYKKLAETAKEKLAKAKGGSSSGGGKGKGKASKGKGGKP